MKRLLFCSLLFIVFALHAAGAFAQPAPVGGQTVYNTASSGTFAPIVGSNYEIGSTNLPGSATTGNTSINAEGFCEDASCIVNTSLLPTVVHTQTGAVEACGYLDVASWHIAITAVHLTSSGTEATLMDTPSTPGVPATDKPQWYPRVLLGEFSGVATSSACESSGSNTGNSSSQTVSTNGSCTAGDLVVALFTSTSGATADSPYTTLISDSLQEYMIYNVASSTGVQTATMTSSGAYFAAIGCFLPGSAPPPASTSNLLTLGVK